MLRSWHVTVRVPVVRGGAGRRLRLPAKLARLAQQDAAAGQASMEAEAWFAGCEPRERDAGHDCGSAENGASGVLAGGDVDPWASALERLRAHLRRARTWYATRIAHPDLTVAELAKREGLAPARVSEALSLLKLSAAIVADLERPDRAGPVPTVADLEQLARVRDRQAQVARYYQLCREVGAQRCLATSPRTPRARRTPTAWQV